MPNWIETLRRLFRSTEARPALSPAGGRRLATAMAATREVELGCDDVFRLLDECAEAAARGEDISQLMPLVDQHLKMCPDCREEYEALLRILAARPPDGRS